MLTPTDYSVVVVGVGCKGGVEMGKKGGNGDIYNSVNNECLKINKNLKSEKCTVVITESLIYVS